MHHFEPYFFCHNVEQLGLITNSSDTTAVTMSKSGKQPKRDAAADNSAACASSAANMSARNISDLLERHRALLAADFKSSFTSLESKLDKIQTVVSGQAQRMTDLESNTEEVSQHLQQLEATCSWLQEDNKWLKSKLSDLEGRSRRQNIRIVGLPESVEGSRPTAFFSQLLVDVPGEQLLPSSQELNRAHRSLAPKPCLRDRLRPVIIHFHRYPMKDLVMREARKQGELEYRGHKLRFYEDYSADILKQRAECKDAMAELYKRGLRPSLLFQAKLRITLRSSEKNWLTSVTEATKIIHNLGESASASP